MTEAARRRYSGRLSDPGRWDAVPLRSDDIIVCTPPKSGTTWTQAMCGYLIFGDPEAVFHLSDTGPWIDVTTREIDAVADQVAAQTHRRFLKSHTPIDGLPYHPEVTYLLVYRHPLDVHFSMRNHVANMTRDLLDDLYPEDIADGFAMFLDEGVEGGGFDMPSLALILTHYKAARAMAERPNVTLLHYADMQADPAGAMGRVAEAAGISHPAEVFDALVAATGFERMKAQADRFAPSGGKGTWKRDGAFFHSGQSRKWDGMLSRKELERYNARMAESLSVDARAWLEWGEAGLA